MSPITKTMYLYLHRLIHNTSSYVGAKKPIPCLLRPEMRSVEQDAHEDTGKCAGNWNSHNPGENKETNSLPVDSLESTVAKTDTNSGSGDTHGSGDWKRVL